MKKYTMEDWEKDGSLKIQIGQVTSDEVIESLLNCLPPTTYGRGIFQVGERKDSDYEELVNNDNYIELFDTFKRESGEWIYCGTCRIGETINRVGSSKYLWEQYKKPRLGENK